MSDKHSERAYGDAGTQIAPVPRISIQGFCESQDVAQVIENAASDRRMSKAHVKVHMGGIAAAIEAYRTAPTPNLIVLETFADRAVLTEQLDSLAEFCDSGTKVMVIGHENDIALYRELTARGVSDYVVAPLDVLTFIAQVSHLYNGPHAEVIGKLIAVVGVKGGVGASTICHNLAWSVSRQLECQTVIVDLDLPFGTAGLDFNQDPPQGIADAVFSPERLDTAFVDRLLSKCSDTLSILAAPATVERLYDLQEQAFDATLDILRSTTPCSILDVPHQWSGWTKRVLVAADEVVLVASPDLANLRNAKTLMDALRAQRVNDPTPRLVLNMVGVPRRPEIAIAEFAKAIEVEPVGIVPFEPKLFGTAANNGQMLAEVEAGSKIVEALDDIARQLMGRVAVRRAKKTLLAPLLEHFVRKKAS
ncbi:AAA family ATPase [Methylocystis sp. MJC1]|jgi:pilus assembly protein CpaE|uniref:AAA family ATPase n=1 Tax=Methylocystis sp. MJC1 TaxID=2654282 RepID=UPI0013ECB572|nr:P-loop NTPase [Methylocystis sp. MJC1]KAF2992702.1 Septum site-determining protein MinD [Methylocystis sp. MJC1]MBU6526667.1 AAA family ATPase [Methylocystis sp. MJC1]UZX13107.1 AAA family ATPase [Methylocystis sp. MJC1]